MLKDIFGFILLFIVFIKLLINLQYPFIFNDPDNFIETNPLITPTYPTRKVPSICLRNSPINS